MATRPPLLTRKRTAWAAPRGRTVFRGAPLTYNASSQEKYVDALQGLVREMTSETIRAVRELAGAHGLDSVAMDADPASQARILANKLSAKFDSLFGREAKALAARMVAAADANSRTMLNISLKQMSGGLSLKTSMMPGKLSTVLNAIVAENVNLIKSIPKDFMFQVQGDILRGISTGNGLADIIPALQEYEGVTLRRARNIALDQTKKAYGAVNKSRMMAIGVKQFTWNHSGGGQKPRQLHVEMDGNIYSFDDLPIIDEVTGERGIPGQAINCGCTMSPVVTFGEGSDDDSTDAA